MQIIHHLANVGQNHTSHVKLHRKCLRLLLSRPTCTAVRSVRIAVQKAG